MESNAPPRSPIYRTSENLVGGDLRTWLKARRDAGTSFDLIAGDLRDVGVIVTSQTVRDWCGKLGIATERAAS